MPADAGSGFRVYRDQNVYEAALDRMRWLFDEFEDVVVTISGGKDSTVIFNLALMVAREKNRLPLRVFFLDQEAEWNVVIEHVRDLMHRPDVKPLWYQVPFRIFNATSTTEHWLWAWEPGAEWMRAKEPDSIHENRTGADRFVEVMDRALRVEIGDGPACYVGGIRVEESPQRLLGLTHWPTYKWATWGRIIDRKRGHYLMHPIYDWCLSDVWHAIESNGWPYCKLYDLMYRYGVPPSRMRVSNLHHETAVHQLFFLQEVEPETWAKLASRLEGIDTAGKLGAEDYFVYDLPPMFGSWREYRDYLLEHLITDPDWTGRFLHRFEVMERYRSAVGDELDRIQIQSILTNDWECIKLDNWEHSGRLDVRAARYADQRMASPVKSAQAWAR